MNLSSIIVRSTAIGSVLLLGVVGCQTNDSQQPGSASDNSPGMTPPAPSSPGAPGASTSGAARSGDMQGGTASPGSTSGSATDPSGANAIERTGGRDTPSGS